MKQYLCTCYPVDKKNGGVSRAWLLEQRYIAKYPNLLVEIALHPAPPALIAIKAGLSEDVLIDILLGKDSISMKEACSLRKAMETDVGFINLDFAFREELSPYGETEDGDGLKSARKDIREIKIKHPAIPLLKKILKEEVPPQSAVSILYAYYDYQKNEYEHRTQITPRTRPFNEWEPWDEIA